ncbi:hypothetical protein [Saccharibacillus kuerlensis]|uniref:Membrane transporter protein n=1 Tax=Saccharibacillus kuerlensis TaxID=459527 RepID=A0ABQ2L7Q8_9BACL|nr:hypothetical protein [Saccharibacillus kuerlensis]GGO06062.1 hypothetical protein GCM10010969_33060 [Saccharibacillus kuerlensis]
MKKVRTGSGMASKFKPGCVVPCPITLGALASGQIGARIASKIPAKAVVRVLSVCLLLAAVRLMFKG